MSFGRGILRIFTWWHGQTLGTQLFTWRKGHLVGQDAAGNRYYRSRDGKRRWVIYSSEVEATNVSVAWHGWLHGTTDQVPTDQSADHVIGNPTGTPEARVPAGSLKAHGVLDAPRDYQEWVPE